MSPKKHVDPLQIAHEIQEHIPKILEHYFKDLKEYAVSVLKGGAFNSNFTITHRANRKQYVLTIFHQRSVEEVQGQVDVLNFFATNNFPSNRIIPCRDQKSSIVVFENRPLILKNYIPGAIHTRLNLKQVESLGKVLGKMHSLPPYKGGTLKRLRHLDRAFMEEVQKDLETRPEHQEMAAWLQDRLNHLKIMQSSLAKDLPKGLIHSDLFKDNIIYEGDTAMAFIDFEGAIVDHYALDIAMTLAGAVWDYLDPKGWEERLATFLSAYETVRKISTEEKEALYYYAIYGATSLTGWRYLQYEVLFPTSKFRKPYQELQNFVATLLASKKTLRPSQFL